MPLPTLQQFNAPLYKPADMKIKGKRIGLAEQGLELQKDQFKETKKHNDAITLFKGYDVAFKNARSEEEFRQIVKETTGKDTNVKFRVEEQEIDGLEVLGSDGKSYKLYGPKGVVLDSVSAIANDPTWYTDPEKRKQTLMHLHKSGVTAVPVKDAVEKKVSLQKDTKTFVKDGVTYKQDRTFDKDSGTYKNVGKPYESKEGVNLTVNTGVQKTTRTKLEEGVISGEKNLDMLARLDDMYDESFLKYTGKAQAGAEDILSKAGLSEGEYLQKRAKWASEVDTFTLLWRKHITGVAGGPQEMKAIEKTVINTKYDSPAKYKAKREQMEIMTKAAVAKDKAYLANGIDLKKMTPEQREVISQTDPLTNYYPTAPKGIDNLYEKFGLEK